MVATSPDGGVSRPRTPGSAVSNVQSPHVTVTGRNAGGTAISVGAVMERFGVYVTVNVFVFHA